MAVVGKTQLRGPQRAGSTVLDEGKGGALTRMVVDSYGGATKEEARESGQAAASAILPLRRELWRLAERLVPRRLAAALRARLSTADPTGRDGVRELRAAIADWLDPPPRCRRCGRAMRPDASAEDRAAACPATGPEGEARLRRFVRDFRRAVARAREAAAGQQADLGGVVQARATSWSSPAASPARRLRTSTGRVVAEATGAASGRRGRGQGPAAAQGRRDRTHVHGTPSAKGAVRVGPPRPCIPIQPSVARGPVARCGTLALLSAGAASLEVMAAALACPRGAAAGYDVAADRDCRALLAATRPRGAEWDRLAREDYAFANDAAAALFGAVRAAADAEAAGRRDGREPSLPAQLLAARAALQRARDANLKANGRLGLGVQARYYSPDAGAMRADLVQGAAIGVDRAGLDFDEARGFRFSTYGAEWARQGCGEAFSGRDLVDTPAWILDLRREVEMRLRRAAGDQGGSAAIVRELLRAIESLAGAAGERASLAAALVVAAGDERQELEKKVAAADRLCTSSAVRLALLLGDAEVVIAAGSRGRGSPALRRRIHAEAGTPRCRLARLALEATSPSTPASRTPARTKTTAKSQAKTQAQPQPSTEGPERARERVAAWVASVGLGLQNVSGAGLLAALRHGCPVFVPVGSGDEREDSTGGGGDGASTQGGAGDGGGGTERAAHVLAAPDWHAQAEDEQEDAVRWERALEALAALRAGSGSASESPDDYAGREAAEVVRRHHGLDGAREDQRGGGTGGGESFQAIADSGLASTGRRPCKEVVRRIYNKAIDVLRRMLAEDADVDGMGVDLDDLYSWSDDGEDDIVTAASAPPRRSPWKPIRPANVVTMTNASAPAVRETTSAEDFEAFREAAAAVTW